MEVLLFVDTETTGLPTDTSLPPSETDDWPRLVEIAWRTYSKSGQELNATSTLIRPDGFEIPETATEVHGITTEKAPERGSALKEVLTELEEEVGKADCLVAHNVAFDRGVLLAEYHCTGMNSSLSQLPVLCTMEKAREVVQRSGEEEGGGPSLAALHEALRTCLADCRELLSSTEKRRSASCERHQPLTRLTQSDELSLSL
jgi:DNA polymerase III epsilon subunit-like protein